MGKIADQMVDDMIDDWFDNRFDEFRSRKPLKNMKGKWRVSGGSVMEIANMSMSHIENTIAFLKKRDEFNPKIQELQEEMIGRYQNEHV